MKYLKLFESFDIDEDSEHLKDLALDLTDEGDWSVNVFTNTEKYNEDDCSCKVILEPLDEFDWDAPGINDRGGQINDTLIQYLEDIIRHMEDYEYKIILTSDNATMEEAIILNSIEEFKKWIEEQLKHQQGNVMTYGYKKDLIIIEFYEKEINESYSDTDKYDDPRTEEDKKNEIEDIVSTELSDEGWTLISKEYKNISGSNVYSFKFNPKSKSNLYLTIGRYGTKEKYLNSDIFNKEVWEIEKILKHTLLHDIGYYAKIHWIDDYGWDYYTDGIYSGQPIHRAIIVVDIIEPSWW